MDLNIICSFLRECIDSSNCNNLRVVICGVINANWDIINKDVRLQHFKTVVNAF